MFKRLKLCHNVILKDTDFFMYQSHLLAILSVVTCPLHCCVPLGISLNPEQWNQLKEQISEIDDAVRRT